MGFDKMKVKVLVTFFSVICFHKYSYAEIVTDGTTGIQVNIAASNNEYRVTENLGTKSGNNLFHSFSTFNVESNTTAIFSGSSDIANVISRVTGDGASSINGSIQSNIEGANFWLLNPNGVIVGENASFDISGSINLSTADYLSFDDGAKFSTVAGELSQNLSMSAPSSFGFLANNSSSIIFDRSHFSLQGNRLVLISRSVTFSDSIINLVDSDLVVVATSDKNTISLDQLDTMEFSSGDYGDVNISGTTIISNGVDTLPVVIKARKLDMVDSNITNLKSSTDIINSVDINVDVIAMTQSTIQSSTLENIRSNPGVSLSAQHIVSPRISNNLNVTPVNSLPLAVDSDKTVIENSSMDTDNGFIQVEVGDGNVMPNTQKEIVNMSNSPCQDVADSSTLIVRNQPTPPIDPMSFNPGAQYYQLDVNNKSPSDKPNKLFTGCSS